jgi:hypothetical protein
MPRTTKDLTADQLRLVLIMRDYNFGRIENMAIRTGQPVFDGRVKIVRVARFGGERGRAQVTRADEFELNRAICRLFEELAKLGHGTVVSLEFRHGLPFKLEMMEPLATDEVGTPG